jgi:mono/diheme cytochrome c family protein
MSRFLFALVALSTPAIASAAASGAAQYSTSCASCHGADGKKGNIVIAGESAAKVTKALDGHTPPMTNLKLTAEQISAVANYVAGMK